MCFLNTVYRFDPNAVQFHRMPPATALEDIQLNLRPTQWQGWTDSLYGYRQLPRQAVLPYYLNTLSISYKAPCFTGASGIEYSYQLEGIDSGWSMPSRNNSVSFVKLPPGSYHFRVKARKSDTDWGPPAGFIFHIRRPWWESIWLRLLTLALLVASVVVIFRLRVRQIRRKASIREQLQELELKALRSQMNPHFIYNALNSIQALVVDNKPHEASIYIGKFGRLLRKVLDHSEQNIITLEEELEALELYIQLEQLRLNVSLQYRIIVDPAIAVSEEWLPPLILQPFAENALWHGLSRKQGERKLEVRVDLKDEWLTVRIVDNGIGRVQAAAKTAGGNTSKGIDITSRRIKEYNSGPDSAFIDITDLYDSEGLPAGTMVTLRIRRA
jgi:anti-sigma regulatory factor (Ser/Thr protein kinase)